MTRKNFDSCCQQTQKHPPQSSEFTMVPIISQSTQPWPSLTFQPLGPTTVVFPISAISATGEGSGQEICPGGAGLSEHDAYICIYWWWTINQYQSISININQYQSISINIIQYQSISININQYQSISININQYRQTFVVRHSQINIAIYSQ